MGYMNWIYSMITDGVYPQFKQSYENAVNNKEKEFMWEHKSMRTDFAKYICILVDKHLMQEYEDHLEQEVIKHETYLNDTINY